MALNKKVIDLTEEIPVQLDPQDKLATPRDVVIAMVLDSSGSMEPLREQVIESFNSFMREQREIPADTITTLCIFDTVITFPFRNISAEDIPDLTLSSYRPSGGTALYDAIMQTKISVDDYLAQHPGYDVLFTIVTDGEENASHIYNRQDVFDMIREQTEQGWIFTYLSADADAFGAAASIGIRAANTVQWAATAGGYGASSLTANLATTNYRTSASAYYNIAEAASTVIATNSLDPSVLKFVVDDEPKNTGKPTGKVRKIPG